MDDGRRFFQMNANTAILYSIWFGEKTKKREENLEE